ncbi:MAG TPA: alpha-L-fucosidase [Terracidiphilus sp.]|jgi:alpha-L-fucosidase|nr:alpha-L-fucosidase [Terracidiphilus sp.]
MALNRRDLLKSLGGACSALALSKYVKAQAGGFVGTRESLESYQIPEWFRDAKFGIWAHWGPQSAIEDGDWYARNMYIQGSDQYRYHVETYGHPSKVGYKDLVDNWKASKWDPDHLMGLYKKAGAKYFFSMGVHHDNFDLWNSKYTRWNAVNMGPKKDVVGMWQKAARNHGLRFGVSEHLWISYKWFAVSHGADKTGPMAGVPYDGVDPKYADLYHDAGCAKFIDDLKWDDNGIPDSWRKHYLDRMTDLIDKYQPDLLYTDGHLPFDEYGLKMVAHLYNVSGQLHGGKTEAVYTSKLASDCVIGTCLLDHERGVSDGIAINPWQTDTCIGQWHYKRGQKYKTPKKVIDLLTDIVSKNGNLLLNFPLPNSGELDFEEMEVLQGITAWMQVNSEGIYSTRPWKIYGEGPSTRTTLVTGNFNEDKQSDLTAADVRFTAKGSTVYAFVMGRPEQAAVVEALGLASPQQPGKILKVELLGYEGDLNWKQGEAALKVLMPAEKLSDIGITLKVQLA